MSILHSSKAYVFNLQTTSSAEAKRLWRRDVKEKWDWKCAYCDKELDSNSATIDHIVPKYKGGHNVKSNMLCSCSSCNRSKGSTLLENWYDPSNSNYSEERLGKIKHWIEDNSAPIKLLSSDKATPYITNDFYIGWISS